MYDVEGTSDAGWFTNPPPDTVLSSYYVYVRYANGGFSPTSAGFKKNPRRLRTLGTGAPAPAWYVRIGP